METLTQWWNSLTTDDKARIVIPFIQLSQFKKPWKADWEHITDEELDKLFDLVREQRQLTHLKSKLK